jgi:hypothetical protein
MFLWWLSGKPRLVLLFVVCALPSCLAMAMVTPPGQVPDEPAHMARAAGLLHGAVLGVRKPVAGGAETSGVKVDSGLFAAAFGHVTMLGDRAVVTAQDYDDTRNEPSDHRRVFASIPNTATYFPLAYVPASLGLAAGLAAHASPFVCMTAGRVVAAMAFLALGSGALWIAAYGEALILTVLLLPMTLFLAGSLNEDGVLIGLACLGAAALTRDVARQPRFRLLALAALAAMLASKPPYLPMLALGLLPLRAAGIWRRAGQVAVAALPVLAWVAVIIMFVVVPFGRPAYHPGPLYGGNPAALFTATNSAANLNSLMAHPALFVDLPVRTLGLWGWQLYHEVIGVLGLLALDFPDRYYHAWSIALVAALLGLVFRAGPTETAAARVSLADAAFAACVVVFTCWLVIISFYLSWTAVGMSYIDGVQGRYALVVLPFLVAAAPAWRRGWAVPAIIPCLPALALGIYDVGYLPTKLTWFFYIH